MHAHRHTMPHDGSQVSRPACERLYWWTYPTSFPLPSLLRHGFLLNLELPNSVRVAARKAHAGIHLSPPPQHWGYSHRPSCLALYEGVRDLNSGFYACTASGLLTRLSSLFFFNIFHKCLPCSPTIHPRTQLYHPPCLDHCHHHHHCLLSVSLAGILTFGPLLYPSI